jgi:hypothetical protein
MVVSHLWLPGKSNLCGCFPLEVVNKVEMANTLAVLSMAPERSTGRRKARVGNRLLEDWE